MGNRIISKGLIFFIIISLGGTCFTSVSLSKNLNFDNGLGTKVIDGQILFCPLYGTTTYLIHPSGDVNHTWSSSYTPGAMTYWLGNGTILRTIRTHFAGGGTGGGIQKVTWDGTITWDFRYDSNEHLSHHDVKMLPNGNVIMIAWESKTRSEAIDAGRNPNYVTSQGLMPDHIIEVQPTGPESGDIVWEWHTWDHLIQDYDDSKDNYGVVADHPELVDINYVTSTTQDLMHTNSIDYNEKFDQILISVHNYNEIWVIDHSTTTEQAAGHTGGKYGKGGDLLYRWGNPQAYDTGSSSDKKLFNQHDSTWIKPGCPGEGDILIFNNGVNRPGGSYSSVDEIIPPVDENGFYYLEPGSAYGPENLTWSYTANPHSSFYSYYIGGAERLADGDTLICDGDSGVFFEVTPEGEKIWSYTNPYPYPSANDVFKIDYIPTENPPPPPPPPNYPNLDCEGSLSWTDVKPGGTLHGSFQVQNIGDNDSLLNWTINTSSIPWGTWSFTPESGFNLTPKFGQVTVQVYVVAPDEGDTEFIGVIHVFNINDRNDSCDIPVYLKTPADESFIQVELSPTVFRHTAVFYERILNLLR
jgi:hypothetical protein